MGYWDTVRDTIIRVPLKGSLKKPGSTNPNAKS